MNPHNSSAGKHEQRRKEPSVELERKWRRIISQWKTSGLAGRAFIREHQLPEGSFYGWKRTLRLRDEERARLAKQHTLGKVSKRAALHRQEKRKRATIAKKESAVPTFVPVNVTPPPATPWFELTLANGRLLRVPNTFDEATLMRLLCALERP